VIFSKTTTFKNKLKTFLFPKGRFPLPEFTARVHGPRTRPVNSGAFFYTLQLGPSWRVSKNAPECNGRVLGPWTRVVETDLYAFQLPFPMRLDYHSFINCTLSVQGWLAPAVSHYCLLFLLLLSYSCCGEAVWHGTVELAPVTVCPGRQSCMLTCHACGKVWATASCFSTAFHIISFREFSSSIRLSR